MNKFLFSFIAIVFSITALLLNGCSKEEAPEETTFTGPKNIKPAPAAPDGEPLVIEAQSGVGRIRRGMLEQQVIDAMGKPNSKNSGFLVYSKLGILVGIGKDGTVFSARFRAPFNGATPEGIRLGSTRAELIQAYGETDQARILKPGVELLHYAKSMMRFTVKDGKVTEIVIDLLKPQ
jgi:hypothetical protein